MFKPLLVTRHCDRWQQYVYEQLPQKTPRVWKSSTGSSSSSAEATTYNVGRGDLHALQGHPTPPHVSVASTSVASTSCARSKERGWRNVNIPTAPHPTPCERSINICRHLVQGRRNVVEGTLTSPPHPTPPHVSVASTSVDILCKVEGTRLKER